nr:hypothetical protein [uncultured Allomuricauda sp.]
MKKKVYIVVFAMIFAMLCITIYIHNEFNRPALVDIHNSITQDTVSADELISIFTTNEELASNSFVEKTIEVKGVIKKINYINNRQTILLKSERFAQSFVICDMMPSTENRIGALNIGDTLAIKGICKGFLFDVIMLNCIPIERTRE